MKAVIEGKNIWFGYKGKMLFKEANFKFYRNRTYFILGPNGIGKTTLLKIIAGILKPFKGELRIDNSSYKELRLKDISKKVAICFADYEFVYDMEVWEFLLMAIKSSRSIFQPLSKEDMALVEEMADYTGIIELLNKNINNLSSGERKLVYITYLMCREAEVYLIDEPFAFLDIKNQLRVKECIERILNFQKTLIIATHNYEIVKKFKGEIIYLKNKKIIKSKSKFIDKKLLARIFEI